MELAWSRIWGTGCYKKGEIRPLATGAFRPVWNDKMILSNRVFLTPQIFNNENFNSCEPVQHVQIQLELFPELSMCARY